MGWSGAESAGIGDIQDAAMIIVIDKRGAVHTLVDPGLKTTELEEYGPEFDREIKTRIVIEVRDRTIVATHGSTGGHPWWRKYEIGGEILQ